MVDQIKHDLPSMRIRKASYNLFPIFQNNHFKVDGDLSRIRDAEITQEYKTFEWKRTYRGVWWLQIN